MQPRSVVYKITYPNGKIYVGMDLTGTALYMGSPSPYEQIVADLDLDPYRLELRLCKEIRWESETATDAEVRAKEVRTDPRDPRQRSRNRLQQVASSSRKPTAVVTDAPPLQVPSKP